MIDTKRLNEWIDLALKCELHAFALLAIGASLTILGHKDEGQLVIGAALGVFRGNRS
jgi:hypothetical protein